jgi:hypothetical protein
MELRRILAVALGLALIFLSVAPYIKARELTMQTPSGWEVLGSKRLRVPTKELQEIYAPDGTPTGRYGRPIDHGWFGEGKLIEIGGTHIWVLDTYQDARGCHVRVRVKNLEGELTTAGGQSQGVQWGDLRLYITWAKFPPEEGDWRTSKGEYFYGFEEFELTLYRVPTAPAIPLSATGTVLGVGLVLFGVAVIREGERRGILPILIGSAFLCALVIRFPGAEADKPVATYARLCWLGIGRMLLGADENLSKIVLAKEDNLVVYDHWGNVLWFKPYSAKYISFVSMSKDGSRILLVWSPDGRSFKFTLYDDLGNVITERDIDYAWLSWDGSRLAYSAVYPRDVVVIDRNGNTVYRKAGYPENENFFASDVQLDDEGKRLYVRYWYPEDGRVEENWMVIEVDTGRELYNGKLGGVISRTGKYIVSEEVYDIDAGRTILKIENFIGFEILGRCSVLTPTDNRLLVVTRWQWDGTDYKAKIISLPEGTEVASYTIDEAYPDYCITPLGDKIVIAGYQGQLGYVLYAFGPDFSWTLPCKKVAWTPILVATDGEVYTASNYNEVFVTGFRYSLTITATKLCFREQYGSLVDHYYSVRNPGENICFYVYPPLGYVFAGVEGNLTEMDWISLEDNRFSIYTDNDKTLFVRLLGTPGTPSVSPATVSVWDNITVSWSPAEGATYYELQVDNDVSFPNPTTYTAISTTEFKLVAPENGWTIGTNYVRVRGVFSDNKTVVYGNWSETSQFQVVVSPPAGLTLMPDKPLVGQNVTVIWQAVRGADWYEVAIDNTILGSTTNTYYVISPPEGGWVLGRTYKVSVRTAYKGSLQRLGKCLF